MNLPKRRTYSLILLHIHAHQIHLHNPHELGHESLQVEDDLSSRLDTMLVEGCPLNHLTL